MEADVERTEGRSIGGKTESVARPKLMDELREALRSRHRSRRTEEAYCHWE